MMEYPPSDRELANLGLEHWESMLDDDNQLHLPSGETLDWIQELQTDNGLTLDDIGLKELLGGIAQNVQTILEQLEALRRQIDALMAGENEHDRAA